MAYLRGNGVQIPRDVRYLDIYEQLASDIDPDRSTLDDKLRGLEFTIARIPELFGVEPGLEWTANVRGDIYRASPVKDLVHV